MHATSLALTGKKTHKKKEKKEDPIGIGIEGVLCSFRFRLCTRTAACLGALRSLAGLSVALMISIKPESNERSKQNRTTKALISALGSLCASAGADFKRQTLSQTRSCTDTGTPPHLKADLVLFLKRNLKREREIYAAKRFHCGGKKVGVRTTSRWKGTSG